VYRKGHYGVALLLFAPVGFALVVLGLPIVALLTGGVMLWLAMLPDVDHRLPLIEHRGPTHSLLFAGVVGAAFGGAGYLLGSPAAFGQLLAETVTGSGAVVRLQVAAVGFAAGTLAVVAHLVGDALTPAGVNFLWPLSGKTYSASLTRADNALWNYGLFALGVFATAVALYLASLLAVG
jgi:inner membrane protein